MNTAALQNISIILGQQPTVNEIVDTIYDAAVVTQVITDELGDGFQISDLLGLYRIAPEIQEIINDAPQAQQQFIDIALSNPDMAVQCVLEARDLFEEKQGPMGTPVKKLLSWLYYLALVHKSAMHTYHTGRELFDIGNSLVNGTYQIPRNPDLA